MPLDAVSATLLTTAALMMITLLRRLRARGWLQARRIGRKAGKLDTVMAWPPQAARVLNEGELEALDLARRAWPQALLLSQVPLWRFLRVSTRHSYTLWLSRAGHLNADLLVCDERAQVLAVIDVQADHMSERSHRRHERLRRVLKAADIPVLVWQQSRLPSIVKARAQLASLGLPVAPAEATRPSPAASPPRFADTSPMAEDAPRGVRRPSSDSVPSDFYGLHSQPSTIL